MVTVVLRGKDLCAYWKSQHSFFFPGGLSLVVATPGCVSARKRDMPGTFFGDESIRCILYVQCLCPQSETEAASKISLGSVLADAKSS